jgi:uncharacterized protein (DUF2336 family)
METNGVQYLENLVKLAEERSPDKRRVLLEGISDLFISTRQAVSEDESALMGDILNQLVHDVEMTVRRTLAERLAEVENAPHDLITTLANDEIDVAAPILSRSGVLQDNDLIEIARHRTKEHMMAVARRVAVSEQVSDALVDNGDDDVIETLLENHNAMISRRAISYLANESQRVDRFQKPLLTRPDLPAELAYEMFDWVSSALRQHIVGSYDIEESLVDGIIADTKKESLDGADGAAQGDEAGKLVQRLEKAGMLTESFLVQTLRDGRVDVFITALATKSGIDLLTARRIFLDRGEEGLAISCKASGFDRSTFASLILLRRKTTEQGSPMAPTALERLMSMYDTITERNARRVLRFWNVRQGEIGAHPAPGDGAESSATA